MRTFRHEKRRQPGFGDLGGHLHTFFTQRCQRDGNRLAIGMIDERERFAEAVLRWLERPDPGLLRPI